jgi:hypothetical protein
MASRCGLPPGIPRKLGPLAWQTTLELVGWVDLQHAPRSPVGLVSMRALSPLEKFEVGEERPAWCLLPGGCLSRTGKQGEREHPWQDYRDSVCTEGSVGWVLVMSPCHQSA